MTEQRFVLGFLFTRELRQVALIRKQRPSWQRGLLNGIGGHIELSDNSPAEAMRREFRKETGLEITEWSEFGEIKAPGALVHCVAARTRPGQQKPLTQTTDEEPRWYPVGVGDTEVCVRNLPILICAASHRLEADEANESSPFVTLDYT